VARSQHRPVHAGRADWLCERRESLVLGHEGSLLLNSTEDQALALHWGFTP
jgi:hypothetical protein